MNANLYDFPTFVTPCGYLPTYVPRVFVLYILHPPKKGIQHTHTHSYHILRIFGTTMPGPGIIHVYNTSYLFSHHIYYVRLFTITLLIFFGVLYSPLSYIKSAGSLFVVCK